MADEENVAAVATGDNKGFSGLSSALIGENGFLAGLNNSLDSLMENNITKTVIIIFLVFYAAFAAPNLPNGIKGTLRSKKTGTIIRIIFAFVIILLAGRVNTLSLALLLAIGFVITLQNLEDKSSDITYSEENVGSWTQEDGVKETPEMAKDNNLEPEIEQFSHCGAHENFKNPGAPFVPVDEGSNNRPRHLPFHAVNVKDGEEKDVNNDGIYSDDYTQGTSSLLTVNLKQDKFTSDTQLLGVQSNQVPDVEQNVGIMSSNPQQGPQGLNEPVGYNY